MLISDFDIDDRTAGKAMKDIREKAGLSINGLADVLNYNDVRGLRRMERGQQSISGPIRLVLEMIHDGRLNPCDQLDESADCPR